MNGKLGKVLAERRMWSTVCVQGDFLKAGCSLHNVLKFTTGFQGGMTGLDASTCGVHTAGLRTCYALSSCSGEPVTH
jgi:hypothetical protein